MKSRRLNKQVRIERTQYAPDGFGGQRSATAAIVATRWCRPEDVSPPDAGQYFNDFGIKADTKLMRFTFRYYPEFDIKTDYIQYQGKQYSPVSVQTKGQFKTETVVIAQQTPESAL